MRTSLRGLSLACVVMLCAAVSVSAQSIIAEEVRIAAAPDPETGGRLWFDPAGVLHLHAGHLRGDSVLPSPIWLAENRGPIWMGGRLFVDTFVPGNNGLFVKNASTVGYGLLVQGGTSTNYTLYLAAASGARALEVLGDGSAVLGSPVGGHRGPGTINAAGVYDDGVSLLDRIHALEARVAALEAAP